jgi:hypothetical protein
MRRKDDMESVVSKNTPPSNGRGVSKSPSSANKAMITRNLRMVYGEIASEPLPPKLLELLNQIEGGEDKQS